MSFKCCELLAHGWTKKGTYSQFTGPREIFSILVKTDCHHAISRIESFFNAISVVNIDINVQHSCVVSAVERSKSATETIVTVETLPEEFEDTKHDICVPSIH